MFRVELLPDSRSAATPGWTYVADRGLAPAKSATAPTSRKRGIQNASGGDISSRRANAIARHIAELDRENQRDVQIPVPVKQAKEAGVRNNRAKTTSNVRRILQSQKTFANHLDDEEAAIALGSGTGMVQGLGNKASAAAAAQKGKQAVTTATRSSTPATVSSSGAAARRKRPSAAATATATPTPAPSGPETTDAEVEGEDETPERKQKLLKTEHDNDPLLRSYAPSMPSDRIMQHLLSEPPLSYNGSRVGPPSSARPPRSFCCMCGYWGKIKCKNCHQRTCGLDCYRVHEDSRCGAFF